MRAIVALLLLLPLPLLAQQASPRFMYIYRDSLKRGVDSTYGAIEDEGAQICADFQVSQSISRRGVPERAPRSLVAQCIRQ